MNISFCIDIERARSYLRYGTSPELIPGGYTHPPTYTPRRPSPPGAFPFPGTPGAEQIYMRKLGGYSCFSSGENLAIQAVKFSQCSLS